MGKATSSTRSVMITRSLCPRSFWTCCANCTRMLPSSPKLEPLGREHNNCTSWAQRTVAPQLRSLWKFSFWTFCTANGKMQVKAEGIFPIHAAPDCIGRLAVGEPFDILHHHDQRQAPGSHFYWTPLGRREISKELIRVERAELGAQVHIQVPFGKGSPHGCRGRVWNGWEGFGA